MQDEWVHVARGKTYHWRNILKEMGFRWVPEKKVWLKWVEPSGDNSRDAVRRYCNRMSGVFHMEERAAGWAEFLTGIPKPKGEAQPSAPTRDMSGYWWNKD